MATIVVGVDGSDGAQEALCVAVQEARLRGAGLRVVTAWHIPARAYGAGGAAFSPGIDPADFKDSASAALETALAALGRQANGVQIERVARRGQPALVLLEEARGADMLVVGSRGHGGFVGLLLGSVSHQCALHAACPVLIVHNPDRTAQQAAAPAGGRGLRRHHIVPGRGGSLAPADRRAASIGDQQSLGSGAGVTGQRSCSVPSSRSRRRVSWGNALDWLACAAAADFWMARATAASVSRSIVQLPRAGGAVRATVGTPASLAAAQAAVATAVSSGSPAAGSMTSSRSAECWWIARRTRSVSSAAGYRQSAPSG